MRVKYISVVLMVILAGVVFQALPASADSEVSNTPHVVAGKHGKCYVKSVPKHSYDEEPRQQGETRIYKVEQDKDVLVHTYDWFSQKLFVSCNSEKEEEFGVALVRLGPWHRGQSPSEDDLALSFYFNGKLVKKYSTLEIAGDKENVSRSMSHYRAFEKDPVLVWNVEWKSFEDGNGAYYTEVATMEGVAVGGGKLTFDMATGEIIEIKTDKNK